MSTQFPDIIHIAGPEIQVGTQLRQRCSWCGAVLVDADLALVAFPVGQDSTVPTWPVGELIARLGGTTWVYPHKAGDQLPAKSCGQLPFDVTGMETDSYGLLGREGWGSE